MNASTLRRWWTRARRAPRRGPASYMALPLSPAAQGLRLTEALVLGVLALAYLLSISAPLFGLPFHKTILNHAALTLLGPVLLVHLLGLALNRRPPPWGACIAGGAGCGRRNWSRPTCTPAPTSGS